MALVVKDRVRVSSTTAGTGALTLGAAITGFQDFSVIGNGNTTYYTIVDPTTGAWEVGIGTYNSTGPTLSRDTVLESSNAGSLVSFASNPKDVFVTYPAERSVYVDNTAIVPATSARLGYANLTQGSALSVLGVTGNAAANVASIAAASDHQVLRRNGTGVAFGAVNLGQANAITGTLPIGNGGTGLTATPTNGQIDIGNGTGFTRTTISAGTAISVTNGAGSISIANTGVTSLTGTASQVTVSASTGGVTLSLPATINVNTTGNAANVTGTVAIANGGTGATTAANARTGLGATTVGGNLFTLVNPSAVTFPRFNADNTVSALSAADFRTAIGAGTGTVTSVTGTSPVASSGGTTPAISLSSGYGDTQNPYASKTANNFLAAPNGTAGVPTFRAIVAADIPTLNQNTTGSAATLTTTRTLWGQNFNGSANVTGNLTSVGNITGTGAVTLTATAGTLALAATDGSVSFRTSGFDRALIDHNGHFLLGRTSYVAYADGTSLLPSGVVSLGRSGTASGAGYILFGLAGAGIGSISQSGTTGVQYNSNSDYRLKENVQPMQNALAKVAQLNPVTYRWKSDGSDGQGFIAHELQALFPEAVSGEKDAVDAAGKPIYQGVDTSFLVATLTSAIQEQQAMINELRNEIAALKGA